MKKYLLLTMMLGVSSHCMSQNILFNRYYTFGTWTKGLSIITIDSSFVTVGYSATVVNGEIQNNALIVKFNQVGDTLVSQQYLTTDTMYHYLFNAHSEDQFKCIVKTPNNNLLAVGLTESYGATNYYDFDIYLVKFDYNLDTLWTKAISHPNDTAFRPNQIIATSDGCYLIAGWQNSFTSGDVRSFLCKVDSSGNVLWIKSYGNIGNTSGIWNVVETADHGFMCGGTSYNAAYNPTPIVFKVDSAGNYLQTFYYPAYYGYGGKIIKLSDGNYLFQGSGKVSPSIRRLVKIDELGNILWEKYAGTSYDGGYVGITEATDFGFLNVGSISFTQGGILLGYICKFDSIGDSLWSRTFTAGNYGQFWDVSLCTDGGYIICGENYCCNFTPGVGNTSSLWLVRVDSLGLLAVGLNELENLKGSELSAAYPNPTKEFCNLTAVVPQTNGTGVGKKGASLLLFDVQGKQLQEQTLQLGVNNMLLNMSSYAAGVYIAVLVVDGYNAAQTKIVKE